MTTATTRRNAEQLDSSPSCDAPNDVSAPAKTKVAVVILADPQGDSEESLGRMFNGLAAAHEFIANGDETTILFQGAGTRWISKLTQPDHPANALFELVRSNVVGVSCGCADVFGSSEEVQTCGFELLTDNEIPGTSGMASLRRLVLDGYSILTF